MKVIKDIETPILLTFIVVSKFSWAENVVALWPTVTHLGH